MTSENGTQMYMPVAPAYNGGYGNGMFGDGNGAWWLLILLIALGGGWGNGFGGYGGNAGGAFPWIMNGQANGVSDVQRGFDQNAIVTGISGVQDAVTSGFGAVQSALCNGFAGVNAGISNGFAAAEAAANTRQIANMQQAFAAQTAQSQGFNALASQFANCCCENRLGISNLTSTILSENCADRTAISDGVRDILANQSAGIQRILDQLCSDKIDSKNEKIADLERQLTMANLAASQGAQTAQILAHNEAQTAALEQYLAPVPRPAYIVQNPNCCANYTGCGCAA